MPNIKPRFEVHEYDGPDVDDDGMVTRVKPCYEVKKDKDGKEISKGFKLKEVKEPAGYMVYFPSGACIRVKDKEELQRQGFDRAPALVDMDSGDEVGQSSNAGLKELSQRKSARNKPKNFEAALATKELNDE